MPDAFSLNLGKNRAEEGAVFIRSLRLPAHVPSAGRPNAGSKQDCRRAGQAVSRIISRLIGQKELVKTAVIVDISRVTAVLSCFREDTGWTKRVGKNVGNRRFIRGK